MLTDLDMALSRLAVEPVHPGLAGMEAAVFSRIAIEARDATGSPIRVVVLAAFTAVTMGIASAGMPVSTAEAAPTLSPFAPSTPLAPSTLLADAR